MSDFDVQHRDCFDSLEAMRDAGGVDLILTSPPYPDARTDEAYGASFDTSLAGYHRLGLAVYEALKPGGVCALNIDGPVRHWRKTNKRGEEVGSERSLIAFEVAIDWAKRVGFRYVEHCAYVRDGTPGRFVDKWRSGWEPVHVFARPGAPTSFDPTRYTVPAITAGQRATGAKYTSKTQSTERTPRRVFTAPPDRYLTTALVTPASRSDPDHHAAFSRDLADAYVLCYSPPGGRVGDPFAGSGTVPFACHRHGRRFIGGDLGIRQRDGARWADVINDGLRQTRLFNLG